MIKVTCATRLGLSVQPLAADEYGDLQVRDPQGRVMAEKSFRPFRVRLRSYR